MSYQSYSTSVSAAQIEARLQEAPRDVAGFVIQIFGALVTLLTTIVGIYVMIDGGSQQLDFSSGEVRQSGSVGAGLIIILLGVVYGAMFVGFGRLVVYVRKMASVLTGMAIVAESTGGTQDAMRVAASPIGSTWGQPGSPASPVSPSGPLQSPAPQQPSSPPQAAAPPPVPAPSRPAAPATPAGVPPRPDINLTGGPNPNRPTSFSPPKEPGWVADPTARHEFRYWDGTKYTDAVGDQGTQSSDPI